MTTNNEADKIDLLPCPFCGSDDISSGESMIEHEHDIGAIYKQTGCLTCGALGSETKEDDIYGNQCDAAWDVRATTEANKHIAELEREIAELKGKLTSNGIIIGGWQLKYSGIDWVSRDVYDNSQTKISELQASNKKLREALENLIIVTKHLKPCEETLNVAEQTLSATPAQHTNDDMRIFTQDSLQAHDDEVIERCAKVCEGEKLSSVDGYESVMYAVEAIRALKGK